MAQPPRVTIEAAGREVSVSNPDKVFFPRTGYCKLDIVKYYVAVADGALRGAGGRPTMLRRFPDGAEGETFYQKRAPTSRPPWIDTVVLRFPSGRTAEEVVPRDAASLAWMANLGCLELHPHAVRARDVDHPDELRLDLDPVPGVGWAEIREVAMVVRATLADLGLVGWPKTSGSRGIHINVRIEPRWTFTQVRRAALAFAREVERRAPALATSAWWKEERHGVFLDYNQNAKDRTVASAYSIRPTPDARVSAPVTWDELATCEPADFTLATLPARFAQIGDPHQGIDEAVGSIEGLLEMVARHEAEGLGDAPWPPHYQKQEGEPMRVAPSRAKATGAAKAPRARKAKASGDGSGVGNGNGNGNGDGSGNGNGDGNGSGNGDGNGDGSELHIVDGLNADAFQGPRRGFGPPPRSDGPPTRGRRQSKFPLVEIGRAVEVADAMAGLERWRARHADVSPFLEAADILVDSMRGRFRTWTRVRVNLRHVPEALRPAPEPLDPDDDITVV